MTERAVSEVNAVKACGCKLPLEYYERDGVSLARDLLGKVLVTCVGGVKTAGVVSETEAYMGVTDRASHAYGGRRTARTETMYLPGGHAYVYLIYGMYSCMNVVAAEKDNPEAVLIRGIIPYEGIEVMAERRGGNKASANVKRHLADGPGRLCTALGIDRTFDTLRLDGDVIYVCDCGIELKDEILCSKRINIDYAGEDVHKLWRFTMSPEDALRMKREAIGLELP